MIKEKINIVRQNIARAARKSGRRPEDITLVCVTKEATIEQIRQAIACGITDIGENRVQDALAEYAALRGTWDVGRGTLRWHFIGHLQTNKAKKAVEIFDLIHSVDSFHLAGAISKDAAGINKTQDILVQVNTSGEQSKFGVSPERTIALLKQMISLNNIRVLGLMTIAPLMDDPEEARPYFRKLKQLSEEIKDFLRVTNRPSTSLGAGEPRESAERSESSPKGTVLSMGMSQDYQVAIEEGATMARIGSAIFK